MSLIYEPRLLVPASGVLEMVQAWRAECNAHHEEKLFTFSEYSEAIVRYDYFLERAIKELKTFARKIEAN